MKTGRTFARINFQAVINTQFRNKVASYPDESCMHILCRIIDIKQEGFLRRHAGTRNGISINNYRFIYLKKCLRQSKGFD